MQIDTTCDRSVLARKMNSGRDHAEEHAEYRQQRPVLPQESGRSPVADAIDDHRDAPDHREVDALDSDAEQHDGHHYAAKHLREMQYQR